MKQKLHLKGRLTTLALCAALLVSLLSPAAYAAGGNGSAVTAISTVATGEGLSERVTQVTLDFGTSEANKTYQYRKAGAAEWAGSVTVNSSGLAILNTSALELHYGNSLEVKADGGETVTVKVLDNALRNGGFETTTVGNASYVARLICCYP